MEKTFSTFHASNVLLQQQYREKGFKKYSDLISHLLVAEHNNDLIMKNNENQPTRSTPLSEVNEVCAHHARRGKDHGHDRERGRGRNSGEEQNFVPGVNHSSKKNHHQKEKRKDEKRETVRAGCFRCGARGHHQRDCRTPKHLVELFHASLKKKEKNSETKTNFVSENHVDITHLDVADFFAHPEGKIDHLIGDGSVAMEE
ncbi:uncharacterized protein LOC129879826 [Solanum dulcamara]|uniref:uncharacterized protein LOC129879826 n=1 Tax=Solanum dulcamara TaxID=45834 RepID=UPI002484F2C0|nr:uncharacterized protein LOC129879826 [Solanum dulcamara]